MDSQQTPSAQTPEPLSAPPTAGKPWLKWVMIVVLVTLLSSATTYFVLQSRQPVTPTISPGELTPPPLPPEALLKGTASWKTYTNNQYGFEIKYPSQYSQSEVRYTNVGKSLTSEYATIDFTDLTGFTTPTKGKEIFINNIKAIELPLSGNMDGGIEYSVAFYDIPDKDKSLGVLFATNRKGLESKLNEFKQILSTFRVSE